MTAVTEPAGWGDLAELRQGLYRFFGGALLLPDGERRDTLPEAAALLDSWGIDDFAFAGPWRELLDALSVAPPAQALEAEYLRLFMAGRDGALCPPSESQYVGAAGQAAASVVIELNREYAELGLAVAPQAPYAADHAATELEAMAALCHQEAHAWEEGTEGEAVRTLRRQWRFLDRHLARWLPRFAEELRRRSPTGFYPVLVDAASAFVRHDRELVTVLAGARLATSAP